MKIRGMTPEEEDARFKAEFRRALVEKFKSLPGMTGNTAETIGNAVADLKIGLEDAKRKATTKEG